MPTENSLHCLWSRVPTAAATLTQSRPKRPTAVLNLFSSPSVHAPLPPVALAFLVAAAFS